MAIKSRTNHSKATPTAAGIVKIAGIQMASGPSVAANLSEAERLIKIAAEQGAKLIVLPEYFAIMGVKDTDKVKAAEQEGSGQIQQFLSATAKNVTFGLWLAQFRFSQKARARFITPAWFTTTKVSWWHVITKFTYSALTSVMKSTMRNPPSYQAIKW
jgi:predicted amidohydrolase